MNRTTTAAAPMLKLGPGTDTPALSAAGFEPFSDGALKVPEAMRFLGCSRSRVYELKDAGEVFMANTANGRNARVCRRSCVEHLKRGMKAPGR